MVGEPRSLKYPLEIYDKVDKTGAAIRFENYNKEVDKHFNIIALTAYAMEDDNKKILNEGFDELLTKPFSKYEIINIIKKHL